MTQTNLLDPWFIRRAVEAQNAAAVETRLAMILRDNGALRSAIAAQYAAKAFANIARRAMGLEE